MAGRRGGQNLRFRMGGQDLDGYIGGVQQFGAVASQAVAFTLSNAGISFSVNTTTVFLSIGTGTLVGTNFSNGQFLGTTGSAITRTLTGSVRVPNDATLWTNANGLITISGFSDTQEATTPATPTYSVANAEANISFSVAQSGLVSLSVVGTLNSASFSNGQALGTVGSNTVRTLTGNYVVPSGYTNTGSTIAISIGATQLATAVVVVGPTALITGATSAVRPATVQLTDGSTAGTNPITSRVWSSSIQTMVDVDQSGLVTAFGALTATITLVVSDGTLSDSDTHSVAFSNPVAPTIFVSPGSRSISASGGDGVAFSVSTTGTDVTVTVSGENAGALVTGLSASADGSWSWSENTGAARTGVIRFTVRDGLSQTDFQEVTVSQAQAVAMATCFTYTFTHGVSGTGPPPNIGSYVLCDGTVQANISIEDGFSACIQEGTALSAGTGTWSQGAGC